MIDAASRELIVTGYVNQVRGAIELLACGTGGKVHESVFVLFVEPKDLQAGLLLLGLKHGAPMPGIGMEPPEGDEVVIEVEWEQAGQIHRRNAEYFVFNAKKREQAEHDTWIFNGSTVEDGLFMAGAEESLIATYWDPWSIINIESELGGDDEILTVYEERVPPMHHNISMRIRAAEKDEM